MRVLIATATFNRPRITALCLENLSGVCDGDNVALAVYDDCSSQYDSSWLSGYASFVHVAPRSAGIEVSRARTFRDFLTRYSSFDLLYLTDNDTIHDPGFVRLLLEIFEFQARRGEAHPVGLFRSRFHEHSVTVRSGGFQMSTTCPGVSQCYTRPMVEAIVANLDRNPGLERVYGWDYHFPAVLAKEFIVTETSYVQHFARDLAEGGIHASNSGSSREAFLRDFSRDCAINPSRHLREIQDSVIERVLGKAVSNKGVLEASANPKLWSVDAVIGSAGQVPITF